MSSNLPHWAHSGGRKACSSWPWSPLDLRSAGVVHAFMYIKSMFRSLHDSQPKGLNPQARFTLRVCSETRREYHHNFRYSIVPASCRRVVEIVLRWGNNLQRIFKTSSRACRSRRIRSLSSLSARTSKPFNFTMHVGVKNWSVQRGMQTSPIGCSLLDRRTSM